MVRKHVNRTITLFGNLKGVQPFGTAMRNLFLCYMCDLPIEMVYMLEVYPSQLQLSSFMPPLPLAQT